MRWVESPSSESKIEKEGDINMTTAQQLVVGIFRDHAQAEQAINELHQAGFDDNHIRFAGHDTSSGSFLEKVKSLFTGQEMSTGDIYDDLVKMGTPPVDARYYQNEYEAGCSVLAVVGTAVPLVAINILARHGGYGANQRFAESANYGQGTNGNAPLNNPNQPVAPSPDYSQQARRQEAANEDANAPLNNPNPRVAPSPDYSQEARRQEPATDDTNVENRG